MLILAGNRQTLLQALLPQLIGRYVYPYICTFCKRRAASGRTYPYLGETELKWHNYCSLCIGIYVCSYYMSSPQWSWLFCLSSASLSMQLPSCGWCVVYGTSLHNPSGRQLPPTGYILCLNMLSTPRFPISEFFLPGQTSSN